MTENGFKLTVTKYHDEFLQVMKAYHDQRLSTSQIKQLVIDSGIPEECTRWLFPSDHCQNHANKGSCQCAKSDGAIFEKIKRGMYRVR